MSLFRGSKVGATIHGIGVLVGFLILFCVFVYVGTQIALLAIQNPWTFEGLCDAFRTNPDDRPPLETFMR